MHQVIVVEVVPDISESKFAVVIVRVEFICDLYLQLRVKELQQAPPILGSVVEHEDDEAEVNDCKLPNNAPEPLHRVEVVQMVRV